MALNYDSPLIDNTTGSPTLDSLKSGSDKINGALTEIKEEVGDLYGRDSILGTVSETAGVPTGAIIERGGNSDGVYIKYADGTINCWDMDFLLDTFTTPDIRNTWTFPEEFISSPTCFGAMTRSVAASTSLDDGDISYLRLANASSTDVTALLEPASGSTFSSGDSIAVNVMAQGRWF